MTEEGESERKGQVDGGRPANQFNTEFEVVKCE